MIITTLWKLPFAMRQLASLPDRRYAVIADEAHSSQTGDAAKDLRKVLGSAAGRSPPAAPKGKALEVFGRLDPATGKHAPFHLYSTTPPTRPRRPAAPSPASSRCTSTTSRRSRRS